MTINELHSSIMNKQVPRYLVFTGPEAGVMDLYIERIGSSMGLPVQRHDTVAGAYSKLQGGVLRSKDACFVVQGDGNYLKQDGSWDEVITACENSACIMIIIYYTLDKRTRFYKKHEQDMVTFERLSTDILAGLFDSMDSDLDKDAVNRLIEVCQNDYSRMLIEYDKVKWYHNAMQLKTDTEHMTMSDALHELIAQEVIYQPVGDITFLFVDAILTRDVDTVAEMLLQAKLKQEPALLTISNLYSGFRRILLLQTLPDPNKDTQNRTGMSYWEVGLARDKLNYYTDEQLVYNLDVCRFVEQGVKTGLIADSNAVEYCIISIMTGECNDRFIRKEIYRQ